MAVLADLKDPRIKNATITYVEVSPDMRQAKVHVSVMGSESQQNKCLAGLQHAAGYLQAKIAKRIDTRYTPRLKFMLDMGVKRSIEISRILSEVLPDTDESESPDVTDENAEPHGDIEPESSIEPHQ